MLTAELKLHRGSCCPVNHYWTRNRFTNCADVVYIPGRIYSPIQWYPISSIIDRSVSCLNRIIYPTQKKKGYSNKIKKKINGENLHGENYGSIRGSNLRDQIYYIRDIINFIRRGYILISERLDHELYAMINADACITRVYVVGMWNEWELYFNISLFMRFIKEWNERMLRIHR